MNRILTRITLILGLAVAGPMAVAEPLSVWAAASMKTALDDVAQEWRGKLRLVYAGTPTLARQIKAGAPADVFISANVAWMDRLVDQDVVSADAVEDVVSNRLVFLGAGPFCDPHHKCGTRRDIWTRGVGQSGPMADCGQPLG